MKKCLIIALILGFVSTGEAQFMDTLQEVFKHQHSIDARLESRYSFYDHGLISVSGVRLGIAFQRKLRVGGGVSWLKTDATRPFYYYASDSTQQRILKRLKFVYLCYYVDFVFYKTKRWQLSVPIQAGTGYCWYQERRGYYFRDNSPKYFMFLYEPGITAQFKIFKWLGLGTDVAYRFSTSNSRRSGINLNSPTYSFKLELWFDQLYFDLFPKSELTKRFGPSFW